MAQQVKLTVPDLGEFADVEVIEVLVAPGDTVDVEDGLVTLETDKASMDVPSTHAGKIVSVDVNLGDKVSTGDTVATIEAAEDQESPGPASVPQRWRVGYLLPSFDLRCCEPRSDVMFPYRRVTVRQASGEQSTLRCRTCRLQD